MTKKILRKTIRKTANEEFYEVYAEYNKSLRNWFVGYGIGLPALLLTNQELFRLKSDNQYLSLVLIFTSLGIALQIISALINKYCNWLLYRGYTDDEIKNEATAFKKIDKLSNMFQIDLTFDIGTIILYAIASYYSFKLI